MVQFEQFNQESFQEVFDGVEIDDRSDRMLLVLLDEMNLARTEYYFSEFLSKLETRRMINESSKADRERAEIGLDMGGTAKEGSRGLRIYPGKNILFVGTMNEDESTQSLSDKVIDRATILRFGRPKKTNPENTNAEQTAAQNGLTLNQWNAWLRKCDDLQNHSRTVDEWIDKLNEALDRMGRPFAFRVDRSIRSYIANYPRWVSDWHKQAMADQIEQRIFPKLRGIETEQGEAPHALTTISNLIDELEDQPLKEAFQKSYADQSTFLFRGVVRDLDA
jgi:5-methylcytosine-specific restriction endonuclease McrBC GTP-binding regulatory subunit McrB